jgi:hypothetical protein
MSANMLQGLQDALEEQRIADVRAFFEAADVASSNDALVEAGREYHFPTYASDATSPTQGHAIMLARDLARVMYGREDTNGLGALIRTYGFDFLSIRGFADDLRQLLRQHFTLHKFDGQTTFATWQHFLLVGMYGQTEHARAVRRYLLQREKASRIADKVEESTGHSPRQVLRSAAIDHFPELRAILELVQSTAEARLLAEQAQDTARKAHAKVDQLIHDQSWMTIHQYVVQHNLQRQMPDSLQKAYGTYLVGYCAEKGYRVYPQPVAYTLWKQENTYYIGAIQQTLPLWLARHEAQPGLRIVPKKA